MLIDTHTHLNFKAFADDWQQVVAEAKQAGVKKMIVVGTDLTSSQRAIDMAEQVEGLYATAGIHPHHARHYLQAEDKDQQVTELQTLSNLAKRPKVVAIGEVGLDYHVYKNTKYEIKDTTDEWEQVKAIQQQLFTHQVALSQQLNKPLIMHSREADEDVLDLLLSTEPQTQSPKPFGVFHCYDGPKKYLKKILAAGFHVSFTGNITFVHDRLTVASVVPLDRLLLETDSPYMTPIPHRGTRNSPANIPLIAQAHADARGISLDQVMTQTTKNAQILFGI